MVWSLMPFFMMISKSLTDLLIVLIALSFVIHSFLKSSWGWTNINWIILAILFVLISCISACFSSLVSISFSNGNGMDESLMPISIC